MAQKPRGSTRESGRGMWPGRVVVPVKVLGASNKSDWGVLLME